MLTLGSRVAEFCHPENSLSASGVAFATRKTPYLPVVAFATRKTPSTSGGICPRKIPSVRLFLNKFLTTPNLLKNFHISKFIEQIFTSQNLLKTFSHLQIY